ncbi:MAG: O-antigen ligase family protein [Bacillus sp. (in: firmicutes)]
MINIPILARAINSKSTGKIINVLEYFLASLLILTSNTVYFRSYEDGSHRFLLIALFLCLGMIGMLSFLWICANRFELKRLFKFLAWFTGIYLVFCILNNMNYPLMRAKGTFFIMYVFPILTMLYLKYSLAHQRLNALLYKVENITVILAVYSLFMWVLGPLLNFVHVSGMKVIIWGDKHPIQSYFNIFFDAQGPTQFLGINIIRNTGIFVEAPMISFVLTVALLINIYLEKRLGLKTVILLITILSTTSTTGVIIAIGILGTRIMFQEKISHFISRWKYVIIPVIVVVAALIIVFFVNKKMQENFNSYSIRLNDVYAGFRAWLNHPFIGNGVGNYASIKHYMYSFRLLPHGNDGYSTGLMRVLAGGGIYLASLYLLPTIMSIKKFWKDDVYLILFNAFMIILFIVTIIDLNYLFLTIITWMWVNIMFRRTSTQRT